MRKRLREEGQPGRRRQTRVDRLTKRQADSQRQVDSHAHRHGRSADTSGVGAKQDRSCYIGDARLQ